jgi:two-component system, cell cycle sensor histidine kinase and response regulator CckA
LQSCYWIKEKPRLKADPAMGLGFPVIEVELVGAGPPKRLTILLVEDEGFLREVTCKVLESAGYQVLSTSSAAEAKRKFRRYLDGIELLLTDVVFPGRDGLSLATELHALSPTLKTIFMSGYPENVVTQNRIHKRRETYLYKPFSTGDLMEKIRRVLQSDESNQEMSEAVQS